jgi:hypothetical protein
MNYLIFYSKRGRIDLKAEKLKTPLLRHFKFASVSGFVNKLSPLSKNL